MGVVGLTVTPLCASSMRRAYKAGNSMAAQTTGWTPPDWVKDLATASDIFPWQPRKADDDEMSILGGIPDIKVGAWFALSDIGNSCFCCLVLCLGSILCSMVP